MKLTMTTTIMTSAILAAGYGVQAGDTAKSAMKDLNMSFQEYKADYHPFMVIELPGGNRKHTVAEVNGKIEFVSWSATDDGRWMPVMETSGDRSYSVYQNTVGKNQALTDKTTITFAKNENGEWKPTLLKQDGQEIALQTPAPMPARMLPPTGEALRTREFAREGMPGQAGTADREYVRGEVGGESVTPAQQLHQAIWSDNSLSTQAKNINLNVSDDGRLFLWGKVKSEEEAQKIVKYTQQYAPDLKLVNRLQY